MFSININGIKKKFKPEINSSILNLELAIKALSTIIIPSDFKYYSRLKTLLQDITDIDTRVVDIKEWADNIVTNLNNAEAKNNAILSSISTSKLLISNTFNQSNIVKKNKNDINNMILKTINLNIKNTKNMVKKIKTEVDNKKDNSKNKSTSKLNIYSILEEWMNKVKTLDKKNTSKKLIDEANELILKNIMQIMGDIMTLTGAFNAKETESKYEDDIQLMIASSETTDDEYKSVFDDPETKQQIKAFENALEFQEKELKDGAEEVEKKLYPSNPDIIRILNGARLFRKFCRCDENDRKVETTETVS